MKNLFFIFFFVNLCSLNYMEQIKGSENMNLKAVKMLEKVKCSFCDKDAEYDARMKRGSWAYMCQEHFNEHGIGLGTGFGQKLIYDK